MKFIRYDIFSESEKLVNEDIVNIHNNCAWVLDGATGVTRNLIKETKSDAQWFVQEWDIYLKKYINDSRKGLISILRDGIENVKDNYYNAIDNTKPGSMSFPSCTIVLVRLLKRKVEYFLLGDCVLIVKYSNGKYKTLIDDRINKFERILINEIYQKKKDENINFEKARKDLLPLRQRTLRFKNQEGGYWVLEFNRRALEFGITNSEEINGKIKIMLMSDGFSQLYTTFKFTSSLKELLDIADKKGLAYLYSNLKKLVEEDKEGIIYPRTKKIDDASAIFLEVEFN